MNVNLPPNVRQAIYIANVLGTPLMAYFLVVGIIGKNEVALWAAEMTAAYGLAAINVNRKQ